MYTINIYNKPTPGYYQEDYYKFDINGCYEKYVDEIEKKVKYRVKELIKNDDDFISKIWCWCIKNNNFCSINQNYFYKIEILNENNLNDYYIKYSFIENELLKNDTTASYKIVNLSYKFKYKDILYNDNINVIINMNNINKFTDLFHTISTHILYNEYNKQSNKDCLKLEHLDKTKEELNKLIENYNSGIKSFITLYDKNYKELEEKNTQFKVILNQDLNQRFETIDIKIKKMQESTERNNDKITFTINEMLNKRLLGLPNKQEIENIPKIHKLKKDVSKFEKDIENRTLSIENKLIEFTEFANKSVKDNKNLIEEYQKNNKATFSKLKSEYTKLTNDLNDHYKELLKIYDKENNNQIVNYQKSIENLSSMNKMLIFMILVCYYIFLFIKYYY